MSALLLPVFYAFYFALFLLPGLAAGVLISARREMRPAHALIVIVAVSAAVGYIAFWIYLGSKIAGEVFSYATMLGAVAVLAWNWRGTTRLLKPLTAPFVCASLAGILYLSCLYLWVNPLRAGVDVPNFRFFHDVRAGDNIIPFIFAERIYDRQPVRPFCCGDWLSSDRPPLQAGIFLLQRPLRLSGGATLQYQLLGTALQCLWIPGVWVFLKAVKAQEDQIWQIFGLLIFASFFLYNSVYAWPKLLAATFVLFVYAVAAEAVIDRRRLTQLEATLAGVCLALALLAHPGSVFSLPALAVLILARRRMVNRRQWIAGTAVVAVGLIPWTLYQKFYDPPGNRLLKMHLAGVMNPDSRSTIEAIRDAYASHDLSTIIRYKLANLETLAGPAPLTFAGTKGRIAQRDYIWNALGVLNLGWIFAIIAIARQRHIRLRCGFWLLGAAAINLAVWSLVLFGPGQTVTAHGSYADILLLGIALAGMLLDAPGWFKLVAVSVTIINTLFVWVLFRPSGLLLPSRFFATSAVQWPMVVLGLLVGGGLLAKLIFSKHGFGITIAMQPAIQDRERVTRLR